VNSNSTIGAALCVGGMTILGGSVTLSRLILDYPTLTGQALRYALAAAVLAAIVLLFPNLGGAVGRPNRIRPGRRDLAVLTAIAAIGLVAFNLCILTALRHADAAVVGTVIGAAPLGLALVGPVQRRERPAARLVLAALVLIAGTALVHGAGHADAIGLLAAIGALVGEVAFSLLAAAVLPQLGAVRVSAWSCALAVPMLLLVAVPAGELTRLRPPTAAETATLVYLALALTVVAFLAWFTGLRRLGVERAGLFVGVLPVATLTTAAIADGRLPNGWQAIGVLLVAVGLAVGLTARTAPIANAVGLGPEAGRRGLGRPARSQPAGGVGQ
jgi:drug/metabolite transporter (DMT)-like permease